MEHHEQLRHRVHIDRTASGHFVNCNSGDDVSTETFKSHVRREEQNHSVGIGEPIGESYLFLIFCCFTSALGGMLFGYDLFVISGAKDLIVQHFHLSTLMEGWFVSSAMVGAMPGCLAAGAASDYFLRKKVFIGASAALLVCSLGSGLALLTISLLLF